MGMAGHVRSVLVDSPGSLGAKARARRWQVLTETFPDIEQMRVVDLGGTTDFGLRAPLRPDHVTVINLTEPGESTEPWLVPLTGDACEAQQVLKEAGNAGPATFDLVISNAVIEHVGGHSARLRFADSVHSLAGRHWVQTPYRYFPLEPHWLFPGFQHLPVAARARVSARWPLSHTPEKSVERARTAVLWTELLSRTEMRVYFPQSRILSERMAGLTKSLIAVKD